MDSTEIIIEVKFGQKSARSGSEPIFDIGLVSNFSFIVKREYYKRQDIYGTTHKQ